MNRQIDPQREMIRAALEQQRGFSETPARLAANLAMPRTGGVGRYGGWSARAMAPVAFAALFVLVAAGSLAGWLTNRARDTTPARGPIPTNAAPVAVDAAQDLTFTGAIEGHWSTARVTQCQVQPVLAGQGAPAESDYAVFMKAPLNGVNYDLTLGILGYHGPGIYRATVIAASSQPAIGGTNTGPGPSPVVTFITPARVKPLGATLFLDPPTRTHALAEVDDPTPATVTVNAAQDGGTLAITFGPNAAPALPQASPPPATQRTTVAGAWSCGVFPLAHGVGRRSPSPHP
jgi:hypothetical protein